MADILFLRVGVNQWHVGIYAANLLVSELGELIPSLTYLILPHATAHSTDDTIRHKELKAD